MYHVTDIEGELVVNDLRLGIGGSTGINQTMSPIASGGKARRTVNGTLIPQARTAFRQWATKLTGSGNLPPILRDALWMDQVAVIECVHDIIAAGGGYVPVVAFGRDFAPGSVRHIGPDGYVPTDGNGGGFPAGFDVNTIVSTRYRPILTCLVTEPYDSSLDYDAGTYSWSVGFEERGPEIDA